MNACFTPARAVMSDANGESTSWPTYRAPTQPCGTISRASTRQDGTADTTSIAIPATVNIGASSMQVGLGAWTSSAHTRQPKQKRLMSAPRAQQGENLLDMSTVGPRVRVECTLRAPA